jgi:hypothetical protein
MGLLGWFRVEGAHCVGVIADRLGINWLPKMATVLHKQFSESIDAKYLNQSLFFKQMTPHPEVGLASIAYLSRHVKSCSEHGEAFSGHKSRRPLFLSVGRVSVINGKLPVEIMGCFCLLGQLATLHLRPCSPSFHQPADSVVKNR